MSVAQRARKQPVEIEFVEWDGSARSATQVIDWVLSCGGSASYVCQDCEGPDAHNIVIDTLEGKISASAGDFVIRGVEGEFYPCKPNIFQKTYEVV